MPLTRLQHAYIEHLLVAEDTGMTDSAWAELAGVPETRLKTWRKDKRFNEAYERTRREWDANGSVFARRVHVKMLEEALANYEKAEDAHEKRQWWKEVTAITKEYAAPDQGSRVDFHDWSLQDLEDEILARDIVDELSEMSGMLVETMKVVGSEPK